MLADSARDRYAEVYGVHIAPWLDDVPLGQFGAPLLSGWQAGLIKAGVSAGTIHKARTLLSSVLRHAAENGAIMAIRCRSYAPRGRRHAMQCNRFRPPWSSASARRFSTRPTGRSAPRRPDDGPDGGTHRPAPGTAQTRQRDALIVSILASAGLRPGELRALPVEGFCENTILVQRAANPDGSSKPTKNRQHRTARLLSALAQDIREYKFAVGRSPEKTFILLDDDGKPWDKNAWHMWRADRGVPASGLDPVPRPYDLRHSFASLLLAEGKQPIWCAKQPGHTLAVFLSTYAHLIDEFENRTRIDADAEIAKARREVGTHPVRAAAR